MIQPHCTKQDSPHFQPQSSTEKNIWEYSTSNHSTYSFLVLLSTAPLEISILPHPSIVFLIPVGVMVKYALVSPPLGYGSNLIIPDLGLEVLNNPKDCMHTNFFMLLAAGWLPWVSSPRAIFLLSSLCASTIPCLAPSVSSLSCVLAEHVAEAACYNSVRQGKIWWQTVQYTGTWYGLILEDSNHSSTKTQIQFQFLLHFLILNQFQPLILFLIQMLKRNYWNLLTRRCLIKTHKHKKHIHARK